MNIELTLENKIALFFKAKREETGNSRAKLAEALGIKTTIVTNYELLRSDIQLPVLFKLFDLFMDDTVTIKGFIRDLEFMDFEEDRPSAIKMGDELSLTMGNVLSEDEVDKCVDDNLRQENIKTRSEMNSLTAPQVQELQNKLRNKKPTVGFGSGEVKPSATGAKAVLKVDGVPVAFANNVEAIPDKDVIMVPPIQVLGNLEVAEVVLTVTESKTENKIVWDE